MPYAHRPLGLARRAAAVAPRCRARARRSPLQRAHQARGPLGRADGGAEVHHGLGEVAGALRRRQRRGEPLQLVLGAGSGCAHGEQPRDDALDIAVDGRGRLAEGDGRNRRRRIGADARQLAQLGFASRETAAALARRRLARRHADCGRASSSRGPAQAASTSSRSAAASAVDRRPAREEALVVGDNGFDRRLLQHDLATARPCRDPHAGPAPRATADRGARGRTSRAAPRPCRARPAGAVVAFAPQRSMVSPSACPRIIRAMVSSRLTRIGNLRTAETAMTTKSTPRAIARDTAAGA